MEKKQKTGVIRAVSESRGGICFAEDDSWWNARGAAKKEITADFKGKTVTIDILDETKRTFNFFKKGSEDQPTEEKKEDPKSAPDSAGQRMTSPNSSEQRPMTSNDYWKNREDREVDVQKQIHMHGCLNSAIEVLNLYGDQEQEEVKADKLLEAAQTLAKKISKWIKEEIKQKT